ncbi:MAG TPA: (S)-ureidoglycine aminohydrolase [Lacipirellulaceae bacterium]|nr:(S)-ureidoglycine aminohydrolase [Lacipirellulaceae bacterium]
MNPLGQTRSHVAPDHAVITPDTHVWAPLPGWTGATAAIHISPALGARFTQATVVLEAEGRCGLTAGGIERVLYPLAGQLQVAGAGAKPQPFLPGDFLYLPAGCDWQVAAVEPARLAMFEKRFQPLAGVPAPEPLLGRVANAEGVPFMGDPDARLQTLLPTDERFDMAVNVFTYQPGAALPRVEIHVMEHGLLMLDGAGVYRLGDCWYPVQAGDVIWMRSFCPQWFVAMGKTPARYLYYKDVNRDPLSGPAA